MNIQDALKETGKVYKEGNEAEYATLIDDEDPCNERKYLVWDGEKDELVHYTDIMGDDWQPYHPKEEIKPSEAGELWVDRHGIYYHTDYNPLDLAIDKPVMLFARSGSLPISKFDDIIHNQNRWKRLRPSVNDGEVIVIEGVKWHKDHGTTLICPSADTDIEWKDLVDKGRMTMTLTIPKEK